MLDTIILGTGTAGSAIATALVNAQVTTGQMTLVDCADVQKKSLITSPTFKEEDLGQPKATALADTLSCLSCAPLKVTSIVSDVEDLYWLQLVRPEVKTLICLGLDNWCSRLESLAGIRDMASSYIDGSMVLNIAICQIGLSRLSFSLGYYSSASEAPCPVCGIKGGTIPESEPCVVLTQEKTLLRGNLREESRKAASRITAEAIRWSLTGRAMPKNTAVNYNLVDNQWTAFGWELIRDPACVGPHGPVDLVLNRLPRLGMGEE